MRPAAAALLAALCALGTARAQELPFARTETREPCANYTRQRQPFFGDTHVHTAFSFAAVASASAAKALPGPAPSASAG